MIFRKIKKILIKALLVLSIFSIFIIPLKSTLAESEKHTIILDLAHRDYDDGVIIDNGASYDGYNEREIVNEITLMVKDKLEAADFNIVLTRPYDSPITIQERITLANDTKADYYISIHANSSETHMGTGIEAYSNNAWTLSNNICKAVEETLGLKHRGVYPTPYYTQNINKNSLLLELGFIDNEHDRQVILDNKEKFADIIATSIISQYKDIDTYKSKTIKVPYTIKMKDGTKITTWVTKKIK